jgi:hypothetical protein
MDLIGSHLIAHNTGDEAVQCLGVAVIQFGQGVCIAPGDQLQ